jgi:hypothetical protein
MVHPKILMDQGIKLVKSIHEEGEFMVSRAAAYHSGFNFGFNIAEAVNFALKDWLEIGCKAGHCRCVSDSVKINMPRFCRKVGVQPEKLMNET